jgi:hypothetical protein
MCHAPKQAPSARRRIERAALKYYAMEILRRPPQPAALAAARSVATREAIAPELVVGVLMIEGYLRPRLFRAAENAALVLSLWMYRVFGLPVLDLSVGPCQVKVSTALRMVGTKAEKRGRFLTLPTSKRQRASLARALRQLTKDELNISLAGRYLAQILRTTHAPQQAALDPGQRRDLIRIVSAHYIGADTEHSSHCSPPYADVLYAVVESLRQEPLGSSLANPPAVRRTSTSSNCSPSGRDASSRSSSTSPSSVGGS